MYIREDADKLRRRRWIASLWATVLLALMLACLWRVDAVCRMQTDTLDQVMELRQEIDAAQDHVGDVTDMIATDLTAADTGKMISLGEFRITHYCPCERCCGKTDGITYTGTVATAGRTIGVDPDMIPLGSTVIIGGHEYVAEDIGGGIKGKEIDMFVEDHQTALRLGVKYEEVKIIKTP